MEEISANNAPESIGPFSQAIRDGDRIYVSGQGPIDSDTGDVVSENIREQTKQTLENIDVILQSAGRSLEDVVKVTVYVTDMATYDEINEVYAEYMSAPHPARSAVEVSDLPVNIGVEIEVIATTNS